MDDIIDVALTRMRRIRAKQAGNADAAFLMRHVAADLTDRLATVQRRFASAATISCLTADAAQALRDTGQVDAVTRVEPARAFLDEDDGVVMDTDRLPLEPESVDLAVSLLALQQENDIPGALVQLRRALKPDGLFLGAMAGQGTLAELRDSLLSAETEISGGASPRILPFADVRDVGGLLQRAGFALPVADIDTLTVRYDDMFGLMRDLRAMGATNTLGARSKIPATRSLFLRAAEIYAQRHSDPDGRVRATFAIIWMSGWAPHESQQKPLKPGSATVSLGDVLKPDEG